MILLLFHPFAVIGLLTFLFLFVFSLQCFFRCSFSLLQKIFRDLFVSSFGWTVERTDPCHLQLKVLIFTVLMRNVNDSGCLFNSVDQTQVAGAQVKLLEFSFGRLSPLSSSSTIIALRNIISMRFTLEFTTVPSRDRLAQSCIDPVHRPWPHRLCLQHPNSDLSRLDRPRTTQLPNPSLQQLTSHQKGARSNTKYKPEHSHQDDWREQKWGLDLWMFFSMTRPHPWLLKRNVARLEQDQRRPSSGK